jgi:hypothetical protein
MKIADKTTMIISFLNTILSDRKDNYYLICPELNGDCETNVGGNKKKYQYIKGDIAVPYVALNEENKANHEVIMSILNNHTTYAFLKKDFASTDTKNKVIECESTTKEFLSGNPKVETALNELLDALKEAKYELN